MSKWIQEFLEDPKARYFVKIDEDFIANSFNLYGLKACVKNYALACDMIRRDRFPNREDTPVTRESVHAQAEILYGLLHARFILTKPGLHLMMENIHRVSAEAAAEYGLGYDLIAGNDIAAFKKISQAMIAQGL